MIKKIALIGARLSTNLGGPSLLVSTKLVLDQVFPGAEYTLYVPRGSYDSDKILAPKYGIKVSPLYGVRFLPFFVLLRKWTGFLVGSVLLRKTIKELEEADVIIDIWGIFFADTMGSNALLNRMFNGFSFITGKLLGKPVIKYTADSGPFNNRWNRVFARFYMKHFIDLILARDEVTRKNIKELKIDTPVFVVPDTAFMLPVEECKESQNYAQLRDNNPVIGISVSYQARNRVSNETDYTAITKKFVDFLISTHGARVILIPNELSKTINDDTKIAENICDDISNDRCNVLYPSNLTAQEIKGVIRQCDIIVASRYHTIVAALSMGIPTLAIGWHHKYAGVLELFNQEKRLCNIEKLKYEDLVDKFEDIWNNRDEIRKTIESCIPFVREQIVSGAKRVHEAISVDAGRK